VQSAQANPVANVPAPLAVREGIRRHIPNILTIARIMLAGAFFMLLAVWTYPTRELVIKPLRPVWPYLAAAALFGLAAVTDAIDGPLARRWNVVSKFGRVMDPFADKLLVLGALIMLAGPNFAYEPASADDKPFQVSGIAPWMVVVILARELLVTSIRAVFESDGQDFSAQAMGKAKMVLQACVIPFILLILAITPVTKGTFGRIAIDVAVWTTLVVTVLSGTPYVRRAMMPRT
jgi:CDP-diacylglycerol--glycerol-3-phosphate 3-phosphatidyltransferase